MSNPQPQYTPTQSSTRTTAPQGSPIEFTRLDLSELRAAPRTDPLYVLNIGSSNAPTGGDVLLVIERGTGNPISIRVPQTWLPINLASYAPRRSILESSTFLSALTTNCLAPISADEARAILGRAGAAAEQQRLSDLENASTAISASARAGRRSTLSIAGQDTPTRLDASSLGAANNRHVFSADADPVEEVSASSLSADFLSWFSETEKLGVTQATQAYSQRKSFSTPEVRHLQNSTHGFVRNYAARVLSESDKA